MAGKKKELEGAVYAETRVRDQKADGADVYSLPVNEGFEDPNEPDQDRGVEFDPYPAMENGEAEEGITRHVLAALFPEKIALWIAQTEARKGGLPRLAADLVAMLPNPDQKPTKKSPTAREADEANMLRALQRSGPAKKAGRKEEHGGMSKPLYRKRIALLRLTEAPHLVIGVRGWWQIDEKDTYRVFHTEPRESEQKRHPSRWRGAGTSDHVAAVLTAFRKDGAGFIDAVITAANEYTQPYEAILISTHELRVEVSV